MKRKAFTHIPHAYNRRLFQHTWPPSAIFAERMRDLENVATSFEGIDKAYAISAGREVRIIVNPKKIDDLSAIKLSRDIATKIESTMQYPGEIKVNVIRETRAFEYAK